MMAPRNGVPPRPRMPMKNRLLLLWLFESRALPIVEGTMPPDDAVMLMERAFGDALCEEFCDDRAVEEVAEDDDVDPAAAAVSSLSFRFARAREASSS